MNTDKSTVIAVIIVIVIIVTASFVIYNIRHRDNYIYKDFKVQKTSFGWSVLAFVNEQPYLLNLRYDPKSVENITIDKNVRKQLLSKPTAYLTVNTDMKGTSVIAAVEIANIISRKLGIFNIETIGALTGYVNNATPVITCNNITPKANVIWLRTGLETKVFLEKECIIIQGTTEEEIARAADRLIYEVLTIVDK